MSAYNRTDPQSRLLQCSSSLNYFLFLIIVSANRSRLVNQNRGIKRPKMVMDSPPLSAPVIFAGKYVRLWKVKMRRDGRRLFIYPPTYICFQEYVRRAVHKIQ